ncbi:MAG: hypothetical protein ABSD75_13955 [Terriglobales bacterium]|jgi:hypothetical protein
MAGLVIASVALLTPVGYRIYVKVMAALKDMLDHSRLKQKTRVISGSDLAVGLPKARSFNNRLEVTIPDTIAFLGQNGIDAFLDGYGVHSIPTATHINP